MTRTMILMSDQPLFDALVIELGRGQLREIDLGDPSDEFVGKLNERMRGIPQHVGSETIEILEKMYGPRLDDNLVQDAADRQPALPPTGALPILTGAILPKDDKVKSPADILNEGKKSDVVRKPVAKRAPRPPHSS